MMYDLVRWLLNEKLLVKQSSWREKENKKEDNTAFLTGLDRGGHTLGDRTREWQRGWWIDGWRDEKSWHGVREHLGGEFWVILLTMKPPSQTKTLVLIDSESTDKGPDVENCSERGGRRPRWREMIWSRVWTEGGHWYHISFWRHQANRLLIFYWDKVLDRINSDVYLCFMHLCYSSDFKKMPLQCFTATGLKVTFGAAPDFSNLHLLMIQRQHTCEPAH